MILAGVLIGVVTLAGIIYLALNKKSNLIIRLACLGAIALMFITLIICIIVILSDKTVPIDPSTLIVGAPLEIKDEKNNSVSIVFSIIFIVVLFGVISFLVMKEHKKSQSAKGAASIDL
jgi:cytochrome bd-type quinol oxidase subunit 2